MEEFIASFEMRIRDVEHAVRYQSDTIGKLGSDVSAVEIQGVPFNSLMTLSQLSGM